MVGLGEAFVERMKEKFGVDFNDTWRDEEIEEVEEVKEIVVSENTGTRSVISSVLPDVEFSFNKDYSAYDDFGRLVKRK